MSEINVKIGDIVSAHIDRIWAGDWQNCVVELLHPNGSVSVRNQDGIGGVLNKQDYTKSILTPPDPELFVRYDRALRVGMVPQHTMPIRNKEDMNEALQDGRYPFVYKLVPVPIEEIDVIVKKKVIV